MIGKALAVLVSVTVHYQPCCAQKIIFPTFVSVQRVDCARVHWEKLKKENYEAVVRLSTVPQIKIEIQLILDLWRS